MDTQMMRTSILSRFLLTALAAVSTQVVISEPALAYIPSTRTILNRMARNVGKGIYQIDQEVQFRHEGDPIVLRERWVVENGDSMRLSVSSAKGSSDNWKLEVIYKDGKRYLSDGSGQPQSLKQSQEFIEPYLHYRSGRSILEALIRQRVLPANLTSLQKNAKSLNGLNYRYETFVRLARSGGTVTYAFGEPTAANSTRLNPGFWVDQDAFQFRRLRFPSQAEVEADKHIYASGGLRIPRDRTITWGSNTASIRILQVRSIPDSPQVRALLTPSSLGSVKTVTKLPEAPQVKEFYQRFR